MILYCILSFIAGFTSALYLFACMVRGDKWIQKLLGVITMRPKDYLLAAGLGVGAAILILIGVYMWIEI
jgi:hypothetical protein